MTRVRRAKLPQSEWEKHKNRIRQLYILEKRSLEGKDGVMAHMMCYNLHAR